MLAIFTSCAIFHLLYKYCVLPFFKAKNEIENYGISIYIVSSIHTLVILIYGCYTYVYISPDDSDSNLQILQNVLVITCGYFLYDTLNIIRLTRIKDLIHNIFLYHHIVAFLGGYLLYIQAYETCNRCCLFWFYALEVSNIMINPYYIAKEYKTLYPRWYSVIKVLLALTYIPPRIYSFTSSTYEIFAMTSNDSVANVSLKILIMCINAISVYSIYKILYIALRMKRSLVNS